MRCSITSMAILTALAALTILTGVLCVGATPAPRGSDELTIADLQGEWRVTWANTVYDCTIEGGRYRMTATGSGGEYLGRIIDARRGFQFRTEEWSAWDGRINSETDPTEWLWELRRTHDRGWLVGTVHAVRSPLDADHPTEERRDVGCDMYFSLRRP